MNAEEQNVQAREEQYQDVSLRAVELLAKAQRAADEAVAEAQSYARDLEASAREQYQQILQRAQAAAQQLTSAGGEAGGVGQAPAGREAEALDAQKLTYVRTYARVAHAQLKSVLAALNDELDQLAALAEGNAGPEKGPRPLNPSSAPKLSVGPQKIADALQRPTTENDTTGPGGGGAPGGARSSDDGSWPPIFAATNAISYSFGDHRRMGPPSEKPGRF